MMLHQASLELTEKARYEIALSYLSPVTRKPSLAGKSQGVLQIGQGNFKYQESQGKVREFHNLGPKYVL